MTDAKNADEIRDEIVQTRAQLAETVDALSAKLDVKAQARTKVDELSARTAPYRIPIAAGLGAIVLGFVVLKFRRRSSD
jgi:hypothetical protein